MSYDVEHYPPINPRRRDDDTRQPAPHVYVTDPRDREYEQAKQVQGAASVKDAIQRQIDVLRSAAVRLEIQITDHEKSVPGVADTQVMWSCVAELTACANRMDRHLSPTPDDT